jgi:antitoxin component YwqK of YwqJK toxin-antitoxin module
VNGERNGIVKAYYESGALSEETPCVNGKKHGISRDYDNDNSNICCLTLYDKDREVYSVKI